MSNSDSLPVVRRRAPVPKSECPLALASEFLGDRWSLLVLREAFYGVIRFDDMLNDLGAPRSMLASRLAKLCHAGLLETLRYQEPGVRAREAYHLTEKGQALATTLIALGQWGEQYLTGKPAPVAFIRRSDGSPLKVALVETTVASIPIEDVTFEIVA
jgi:Predicted transcriptional regulators